MTNKTICSLRDEVKQAKQYAESIEGEMKQGIVDRDAMIKERDQEIKRLQEVLGQVDGGMMMGEP